MKPLWVGAARPPHLRSSSSSHHTDSCRAPRQLVALCVALPPPSFPATQIPGSRCYYTRCPLRFGIQRYCHTDSHMHTHGRRGTAHTYLQDGDVQKTLTICEPRGEPAEPAQRAAATRNGKHQGRDPRHGTQGHPRTWPHCKTF